MLHVYVHCRVVVMGLKIEDIKGKILSVGQNSVNKWNNEKI